MSEMLVGVFPVWICQKAQEMAPAPAVPLVCGWTGGVNQDMAAIPFLMASKEEEGRAFSRGRGTQRPPKASLTWHGELGEVWQSVGEGDDAPTAGAGHATGEG